MLIPSICTYVYTHLCPPHPRICFFFCCFLFRFAAVYFSRACVGLSVSLSVCLTVDRSVGLVGGSYCQCFAMQMVCTVSCNCHHCYNNANQESMRMQAINGVLERNPAAFDAKFKETEVRSSVKCSMRTPYVCSNLCLVRVFR